MPNLIYYSTSVTRANELYKMGQYTEAATLLHGIQIEQKDETLYGKIVTVIFGKDKSYIWEGQGLYLKRKTLYLRNISVYYNTTANIIIIVFNTTIILQRIIKTTKGVTKINGNARRKIDVSKRANRLFRR